MKLSYFMSATLLIIMGCSRSDFLNVKPQKSLLIPTTLEHYQAILDEDITVNGAAVQGVTPQLGESGSDNFYLLDANFNSNLRPQMQNYYIWADNPYEGVSVLDWEYPYTAILYANTVLDGIAKIEQTEQNREAYDNLVGQALFHRAYMFHQLAQVFAPVYNPNSNNDALGIILRLESDINETLTRATVQETYEKIINDVSASIALLNDSPAHKCRPSKQAGYGLLARVYLTMGNYDHAKLYADSCMQIQSSLFDYNLANPTIESPFQGTRFSHPINQEVVFFSAMLSAPSQNYPTTGNFALVDSSLYESYHIDDLRRTLFFHKQPVGHRFKGTYSFRGFTHYFSGLAVDEILLIRAECNARLGNLIEALADINRLLSARWKAGAYLPHEGLDADETLSLVLVERRKQLLYRGVRWSDLRRLNLEGHNIALSRKINGQTYVLPPDDPRWTWPLPLEVIR